MGHKSHTSPGSANCDACFDCFSDVTSVTSNWLLRKEKKIKYSISPLIRTLAIRTAYYPDLLGPSGKFVENSTKLTCLGHYWLSDQVLCSVRNRYKLNSNTEIQIVNLTYLKNNYYPHFLHIRVACSPKESG